MSDFTKIIPIILQHEGGFVNNPNDPGSATNMGITLAFIQAHPQDCDFNGDGVIDIKDLKSMTKDQASFLYQKYWFNWYNINRINDNTLACKIMDYDVNMGTFHSTMLLQMSMNTALNSNVGVDGILGPMTIATINNITSTLAQQSLIDAYSNVVWNYYQSLITHNPKLATFGTGWKNRAFSINKAGMLG